MSATRGLLNTESHRIASHRIASYRIFVGSAGRCGQPEPAQKVRVQPGAVRGQCEGVQGSAKQPGAAQTARFGGGSRAGRAPHCGDAVHRGQCRLRLLPRNAPARPVRINLALVPAEIASPRIASHRLASPRVSLHLPAPCRTECHMAAFVAHRPLRDIAAAMRRARRRIANSLRILRILRIPRIIQWVERPARIHARPMRDSAHVLRAR